jgi:hypothetical protein
MQPSGVQHRHGGATCVSNRTMRRNSESDAWAEGDPGSNLGAAGEHREDRARHQLLTAFLGVE